MTEYALARPHAGVPGHRRGRNCSHQDSAASPAPPSAAPDRPMITHGVQSGDVSVDAGVVWARADRPSRMLVEVATTDSFKTSSTAIRRCIAGNAISPPRLLIENLPAGQDIFYRIRFQDSLAGRVRRAVIGRFRTAPADRRSVAFVWSGDTAGQGWGIDVARGGMRTYATMLKNRPGLLHPQRRQHLLRRPDRGRAEAAGRRSLAKHRHRGEIEDRRDARRIPRRLQIQSARQQFARVQRRGADVRAVGQP